jgi:hypothetical protein
MVYQRENGAGRQEIAVELNSPGVAGGTGPVGYGDYPAIAGTWYESSRYSTWLATSQFPERGSDYLNFVVVWHNVQDNNIYFAIYRYDLSNPTGGFDQIAGGQANEFGPGSNRPAVAVLNVHSWVSGIPTFVIVWEDAGYASIRGRVFDAHGSPVTNEIVLHQHSLGAAPSIVALPHGNFFLAFMGDVNTNPDNPTLWAIHGGFWSVQQTQ